MEHCHCEHHSCEHSHEKKDMMLPRIIVATVLLGLGLLVHFAIPVISSYAWILYALSLIVVGYDVAWRAVRGIVKGKVLDECFLMTLAAICAFIIGEYPEGAAVILLYQIGEYLCDKAVGKSRSAISELMELKPDTATVIRDGQNLSVSPSEVAVGETIFVRAGERIPLDGVILDGDASLDTSALTGESKLRYVGIGDSVLSGCVNLDGLLKIRVSNAYSESTFSRILELMENTAKSKSTAEAFITKFAKWYTPIVVVCAVLLSVIPPLLFAQDFSQWLHRGLIFLVISCPCALVISIPLSYFCGIGGASRQGILIKSSIAMEKFSACDSIAFDKTGTLTQGRFSVSHIDSKGIDKEQFLYYAAHAEMHSSHPLAFSIRTAYAKELNPDIISHYQEISGKGIAVTVDDKHIIIGNGKLMAEHGFTTGETDGATCIHMAVDSNYCGCVYMEDALKDDSKKAIAALSKQGLSCYMLSGDTEAIAQSVADELKLDGYKAELLPQDKVSVIADMQSEHRIAFAGDGINDAPVLIQADVGIAMGAIGSDAAIEAAEIVIMDDAPSKIPVAHRICKKSMRIAKENIAFALIVKLSVMGLSVFGLMSTWVALFADVGVCLLAVCNSLRCMKRHP